ncbi:MAG TPA: cupin domain-containing protein [Holophaga sp.]|jgi:quercetin dioxygenase-like cupin family protein|nr:cupin domain-containing protein [Holophaga sp.]
MFIVRRPALLVTLLLIAPLGAAPDPVSSSAEAPPPVVATPLLKTAATWDGAPIAYPRSERPEIQTVRVEIAVGGATSWHQHPVNNIAYVLEGSLRLELEDGTTRIFKAGEAFAEVVDTWHRGVNVGSTPAKLLVVYMGEIGKPLSIAKGGSAH